MIASESSAQHSLHRFYIRMEKQPAYGKTIAHSFGNRNHIGLDRGELMGEKLPGSSVPALHFIEDEQGTRLLTLPLKFFQKIRTGCSNAAHALNTFDDDCRRVMLNLVKRFFVVKFYKRNWMKCIERGENGGIISGSHRARRASVKCFFESDNFFSAGNKTGRLQSVLVGFGAGVAKE